MRILGLSIIALDIVALVYGGGCGIFFGLGGVGILGLGLVILGVVTLVPVAAPGAATVTSAGLGTTSTTGLGTSASLSSTIASTASASLGTTGLGATVTAGSSSRLASRRGREGLGLGVHASRLECGLRQLGDARQDVGVSGKQIPVSFELSKQ